MGSAGKQPNKGYLGRDAPMAFSVGGTFRLSPKLLSARDGIVIGRRAMPLKIHHSGPFHDNPGWTTICGWFHQRSKYRRC